jgi:site-specific recombinase XerD
MWQDLFRRADLITRLSQNPWSPYLDEFVGFLGQQHYSTGTIRRAVVAAGHLACWLSERQLSLSDTSASVIAQYRDSLGPCPSGSRPERSRGVLLALRFLEQNRVILPKPATLPETPAMRWLNRFDEHLERVAGAAVSTPRQYEFIAARFLQQRFGDAEPEWSQVSADDLSSFAQSEAARRKGFGRKVPGVALRAFLRFLVAHGCIRDGLAAAIPSPRQYQHATLPDRATAEQVNAVLARCQDGTPVGLRDYAVVLLLVRLGLRALEVVRLRFDDVDWRGGVLLVRAGKTRRERRLPLTEEIGTALAAYIRRGRPFTSIRTIFLHAQPPHRPWRGASAVSQLVHRRLLQSGYPAHPWRGAHLFRHTVASQMVNAGVSFKDVADVLGHQSLATTGLYAKLDLDNLNRVALPWPGGLR